MSCQQTDGPDASFVVDVRGGFRPGDVRIHYRPLPAPDHPQVEQFKAAWPRHVEEVRRRGGVLFNGPMVRYLRHRVEGGRLEIEAEASDFATFFCTNYTNPDRGDEIGWQHYGNPVGISANVLTSDGWIVYGRRGQRVACHPGTIHAFGGGLEPGDRNAAGELDPFISMARELREELTLTADTPIDLVCLGLIRDAQIRQPELVFDARLPLTCRELVERIGPDDEEHDSAVTLPDEAPAIDRFLQETPLAVPILRGALYLHGQRAFGESF